ncbi:sulfatase-like hydrolase/transferase [Gayadomonas joobiniege]|uniref:sulfatase-like hydrolase/transferase n=1 Tax=Gayadomonas joobiniege TaxID=1234606 RepID=UPI00036C5B8A|nr:sulfatase-like hydrolase/transferase [Gayadomonas joobiniege]
MHLNINQLMLLCAALLLTGCYAIPDDSTTDSAQFTQPNILFIYTDDQAPWALGAAGNAQAFTPNMDKLAATGMQFPNAYTTTPVCSPSRAGLLTSRYGYELGIDDWINTHYPSMTRKEPNLGVDPSLPTWPKILQQQGYHTGLVGKWHLGELDKFHPTAQGYDEFVGFRSGGNKTKDPSLEKQGKVSQYQGLTSDILTDQAIDFIQRNRQKRFALSLHYRAPHTQWLPVAEADAAPYKELDIKLPHPDYPNLDVKKAKRFMKEYLSSVRSVDRNIGRLLEQLKALKLTKNTLIVFTSDHGYNMAHNGIWHKGNGHWLLKDVVPAREFAQKNQRPNMYDNSIKVPTIVVWPGVVEAGSKNLSTISNLDWFPTLVEIAQGQLPANAIIRGNSFLPALLDSQQRLSTEYYAAYTTLHQSKTQMRMYSDGRYKLVKDFRNNNRDEFYDLQADPDESQNLINTNQPELMRIINQFDDIIFEKMLKTKDPVLNKYFPKNIDTKGHAG